MGNDTLCQLKFNFVLKWFFKYENTYYFVWFAGILMSNKRLLSSVYDMVNKGLIMYHLTHRQLHKLLNRSSSWLLKNGMYCSLFLKCVPEKEFV